MLTSLLLKFFFLCAMALSFAIAGAFRSIPDATETLNYSTASQRTYSSVSPFFALPAARAANEWTNGSRRFFVGYFGLARHLIYRGSRNSRNIKRPLLY